MAPRRKLTDSFKNCRTHIYVGDSVAIVKMDERGRIQLPQDVRRQLRLKPRQALTVEVKGDEVAIRRARRDVRTDPLLRDIFVNPLNSGGKVTRELLEKLKEEQWTP